MHTELKGKPEVELSQSDKEEWVSTSIGLCIALYHFTRFYGNKNI